MITSILPCFTTYQDPFVMDQSTFKKKLATIVQDITEIDREIKTKSFSLAGYEILDTEAKRFENYTITISEVRSELLELRAQCPLRPLPKDTETARETIQRLEVQCEFISTQLQELREACTSKLYKKVLFKFQESKLKPEECDDEEEIKEFYSKIRTKITRYPESLKVKITNAIDDHLAIITQETTDVTELVSTIGKLTLSDGLETATRPAAQSMVSSFLSLMPSFSRSEIATIRAKMEKDVEKGFSYLLSQLDTLISNYGINEFTSPVDIACCNEDCTKLEIRLQQYRAKLITFSETPELYAAMQYTSQLRFLLREVRERFTHYATLTSTYQSIGKAGVCMQRFISTLATATPLESLYEMNQLITAFCDIQMPTESGFCADLMRRTATTIKEIIIRHGGKLVQIPNEERANRILSCMQPEIVISDEIKLFIAKTSLSLLYFSKTKTDSLFNIALLQIGKKLGDVSPVLEKYKELNTFGLHLHILELFPQIWLLLDKVAKASARTLLTDNNFLSARQLILDVYNFIQRTQGAQESINQREGSYKRSIEELREQIAAAQAHDDQIVQEVIVQKELIERDETQKHELSNEIQRTRETLQAYQKGLDEIDHMKRQWELQYKQAKGEESRWSSLKTLSLSHTYDQELGQARQKVTQITQDGRELDRKHDEQWKLMTNTRGCLEGLENHKVRFDALASADTITALESARSKIRSDIKEHELAVEQIERDKNALNIDSPGVSPLILELYDVMKKRFDGLNQISLTDLARTVSEAVYSSDPNLIDTKETVKNNEEIRTAIADSLIRAPMLVWGARIIGKEKDSFERNLSTYTLIQYLVDEQCMELLKSYFSENYLERALVPFYNDATYTYEPLQKLQKLVKEKRSLEWYAELQPPIE